MKNPIKENKQEEKKTHTPALHEVGGSFCKSFSSFKIRFEAIDAPTSQGVEARTCRNPFPHTNKI